jgi:hypothetical protein
VSAIAPCDCVYVEGGRASRYFELKLVLTAVDNSPWPAFKACINVDRAYSDGRGAYKVQCTGCKQPLGHEFVGDGPRGTSRWRSQTRAALAFWDIRYCPHRDSPCKIEWGQAD